MNIRDDGHPNTILGQVQSTRRGNLLLTSIEDTPQVLNPDQLILWGLGEGQWYLTLGPAVPDWKLEKVAETEGIDLAELRMAHKASIHKTHEQVWG